MRVQRKLTLKVSENDDGTLCKFDDEGQLSLTTTAAAFATMGGSNNLSVANSDGDVPIPFGSIATAHVLLIVSDRRVNVKINGGSEEIPVDQVGGAAGFRAVLYLETVLTSVVVNNPDAANTASVLYAISGV
jgi:hypothetical protein